MSSLVKDTKNMTKSKRLKKHAQFHNVLNEISQSLVFITFNSIFTFYGINQMWILTVLFDVSHGKKGSTHPPFAVQGIDQNVDLMGGVLLDFSHGEKGSTLQCKSLC